MNLFICIALAANLIAFLQFAMDKRLAEKKKWRISEFQLILPTVFGGFVGTLFGMIVFRHKTKKRSLQLKLLIALLLFCGIVFYAFTGSPE